MPEGAVRLVVQADDFGMCHAVNQAIETAFTDGLVTQASIMAACPWADEAFGIARRTGIPLGLHQTLTCDWDRMRWRPLTDGKSLSGEDGMFRATVAEAAQAVDAGEATDELLAQARRVTRAGLRLGYLDVHMGAVCPRAYQVVSEQLGLPFLYPGLTTSLSFASLHMLSEHDKEWLIALLDRLEPGLHLLVAHPGVAGPELAGMTSPESPVYRWAEEYRASDLALLVDPDVRMAVERRSIQLTSVAGTGPGT